MKSSNLLYGLILVAGFMFWGCQDVVFIDRMEELEAIETEIIQEEISLKSAETLTEPICTEQRIPLIAGQMLNVGELIISNNVNFLSVDFSINSIYTITEVHLWVGVNLDEVPMNKNEIPIPGKFPMSGKTEYSFNVKLTDIDADVDALLNGKTIYVFAHANLKNNKTSATESAWSQGKTFGTKRWGMYSVYSCCDPQGPTAGCYPHIASCGSKFEGIYYYDNNIGGNQIILADNGEIAGTAIYSNGKFYFNFDQDWSFTDLLPDPIVLIHGCEKPNTSETLLFSDNPEYNKGGPYTASVSNYPYYRLELNIQHCTTQ